MITLFLSDGLGNQMFQYAFARALQLTTSNKLQLCVNGFDKDKSLRKYSLHNLSLPENVTVLSEKRGFKAMKKFSILNRIRLGFNNSAEYFGKAIISMQTKNIHHFEDLSKHKFYKKIYVFGQFQTYKYFDEFKKTIVDELKVKTTPSKENQQMLKKIEQTNSVCVHIRRGDYLDKRWSHLNVCDYNYYLRAMEQISSTVESPLFYIFSNSNEDIEWIKSNYDFSKYNTVFVNLNNPDYEDIRLMYSCKHFIISNSTFSWWGQYLSDNPEKIVIAPSKWNSHTDCENIYMPDWHLLEV